MNYENYSLKKHHKGKGKGKRPFSPWWHFIDRIERRYYNKDCKEEIMMRMEKNGIQTRPVWRLNHKQKPYKNCQNYKIENAKRLVSNSLCLPSSANLSDENLYKVLNILSG